jgi:hypothetical protein
LFGGGFFILFGICAVVMLLRLLHPPCRVRMDTEGVQLGQRKLNWSEIRCLSFKMRSGEGWLTIRAATPVPRRFLIPGRGMPPATWSGLADQLKCYFKQTGLNVDVEVSEMRVR